MQAKSACQGVCQGGLSDAWHVFNQKVATGQQTSDTILSLIKLSHNHRVKLIDERGEFFLNVHKFDHTKV